MKLTLLLALLCTILCGSTRAENPGAGFLMVFPDARTTALGGCGTASELGANCYYNPASLGFGPKAAATVTHVNWFEWGISYSHFGVSCQPLLGLGAAISASYLQSGVFEVIDPHGHAVYKYRAFDLSPALSAGYRLRPSLSAGASVKFVYSRLPPDWMWQPPYSDVDEALTFACDAGVLSRPLEWLKLGLALDNLGPRLRYNSIKSDRLPTILRFGWEIVPAVPGPIELRLVSDVWRELVSDLKLPQTPNACTKFLAAWEQLEAGIGLEARFARIVSIRLGYFEDIQGYRGGIVVKREGWPRHISLFRRLLEPNTGELLGFGLCWGVGLELRNVAIDVAVDDNIYDFATYNLRFQLSWRL